MTRTPDARPAWRFAALWRRWLFLFLIAAPSILAAAYLSVLLPNTEASPDSAHESGDPETPAPSDEEHVSR